MRCNKLSCLYQAIRRNPVQTSADNVFFNLAAKFLKFFMCIVKSLKSDQIICITMYQQGIREALGVLMQISMRRYDS